MKTKRVTLEEIAHCRYMDDTLLWCGSRSEAEHLADHYRGFVGESLQLHIKKPIIQRCDQGLAFLGCRVQRWRIQPSQRRLRRYKQGLRDLDTQLASGLLDERTAQQRSDALVAMLQPAQSLHWRRQWLARRDKLEMQAL